MCSEQRTDRGRNFAVRQPGGPRRPSHHHSRPRRPRRRLHQSGARANTVATCRSAWGAFTAWCRTLGLRNRSLLLVGFGGALRRSEIVALNADDVAFVNGKGVVLSIRRSKTDQVGAGDAVAIWAADDDALCALPATARSRCSLARRRAGC
ncbi:site-specific recombinase XerC [Azospirillum canadense]|nr:site-specific recombinase XerC [Azospirillum canadense]